MENNDFDVFIIGSGVAGQTVASECAKEGLKIGIAENKVFGGTCPNRGCDPKKVLLGPTGIMESANAMMGKGVEKLPKLNWKKLQSFKRTFTKDIPKGTKNDLEEKGVQLFSSSPKFVGSNELQIDGETLTAKNIVIATGLKPRPLEFKGNKHLLLSEDFLSLKELPKEIIFLGAGYIGMEFAHMAARAGSKVTVLEHGERPLKPFDADLVADLTKGSKGLGINYVFNAEVQQIEKKGKQFKVIYRKDDKKKSKKAGVVFNTTGRIPAIEELDLEQGNVSHNKNGIEVNGYLQSTSNKTVYACGDVSDCSVPLSPLSGYEAYTVAQNIINDTQNEIELPLIPSVVFTLPNLASVGYSEEEAKRRYKNVAVKHADAAGWYNNKRIQGSAYAFKVLINERTNLIVGAHLLSNDAAETINLFTLAMNQKVKVNDLKKMIFTYPSWSNDIKSML